MNYTEEQVREIARWMDIYAQFVELLHPDKNVFSIKPGDHAKVYYDFRQAYTHILLTQSLPALREQVPEEVRIHLFYAPTCNMDTTSLNKLEQTLREKCEELGKVAKICGPISI